MIRILFSVLCLCFLNWPNVVGQVFSIFELDKYEKQAKNSPVLSGDYVEINSILVLQFEKDRLFEEMQAFSGGKKNLKTQLSQLQHILESRNVLEDAIKEFSETPGLSSLEALGTATANFLEKIEKNPDTKALYEAYSKEYTAKFVETSLYSPITFNSIDYIDTPQSDIDRDDIPLREAYILDQFGKKAQSLAQELQKALTDDEIHLVLSGEIITKNGPRPIKLSKEFDSYDADVFTVPRWQSELSEVAKKQFQAIDSLTNSSDNSLKLDAAQLERVSETFGNSVECLTGLVEREGEYPGDDNDTASEESNELIKNYFKLLKALEGSYEALVSALDWKATNQDFAVRIKGEFETTLANFQNLKAFVKDNQNALAANQNFEDLTSCISTVKKNLENLQKVAYLSSSFQSFNQTNESLDWLSDKLKRLNYDAVPRESFIDLRITGQRENGDQIKIEAFLEKKTQDRDDVIRKRIDWRIFKLQQIGLYSVMKPLLLLANPSGDGRNDAISGEKFQFAASYSFLFKFGSRRSKGINEIWQPCLGVNLGALDFNTDANPEFSIALEFTFLRDYFSTGYGYNFGVNEQFFLLGFRLPIGAFPLPILNEVESQNY